MPLFAAGKWNSDHVAGTTESPTRRKAKLNTQDFYTDNMAYIVGTMQLIYLLSHAFRAIRFKRRTDFVTVCPLPLRPPYLRHTTSLSAHFLLELYDRLQKLSLRVKALQNAAKACWGSWEDLIAAYPVWSYRVLIVAVIVDSPHLFNLTTLPIVVTL